MAARMNFLLSVGVVSEGEWMSMPDDAELIARIQDGDLNAFETLYNKHKRKVFQTALAITRDRNAAEEILQDCLVRTYTNIHKLNGTGSISPWLHRVTVNLSYSWGSRRRPFLLPLEEMLKGVKAPASASPERCAERKETQGVVQEAIRSLSPKHRAVVVLYYLHGFSLNEIAYILECPVGTVKSRLHYACRNLRRHLEDDRRVPAGVAYEFS